jgi:hypothetical protein
MYMKAVPWPNDASFHSGALLKSRPSERNSEYRGSVSAQTRTKTRNGGKMVADSTPRTEMPPDRYFRRRQAPTRPR